MRHGSTGLSPNTATRCFRQGSIFRANSTSERLYQEGRNDDSGLAEFLTDGVRLLATGSAFDDFLRRNAVIGVHVKAVGLLQAFLSAVGKDQEPLAVGPEVDNAETGPFESEKSSRLVLRRFLRCRAVAQLEERGQFQRLREMTRVCSPKVTQTGSTRTPPGDGPRAWFAQRQTTAGGYCNRTKQGTVFVACTPAAWMMMRARTCWRLGLGTRQKVRRSGFQAWRSRSWSWKLRTLHTCSAMIMRHLHPRGGTAGVLSLPWGKCSRRPLRPKGGVLAHGQTVAADGRVFFASSREPALLI
jgi:hypothetical protein